MIYRYQNLLLSYYQAPCTVTSEKASAALGSLSAALINSYVHMWSKEDLKPESASGHTRNVSSGEDNCHHLNWVLTLSRVQVADSIRTTFDGLYKGI